MQPPTSAAKVACAAIKTPINPAASKPFIFSVSVAPIDSPMPIIAPGRAPQEPAVGAATGAATRRPTHLPGRPATTPPSEDEEGGISTGMSSKALRKKKAKAAAAAAIGIGAANGVGVGGGGGCGVWSKQNKPIELL